MRWKVVITEGGTASDPVLVHAPSFKGALEGVRRARGESESIENVSMNLDATGCHALDPETRVRYDITKDEDAPPVDSKLVASRDEDPSAESPICYRERAYAVSKGTSDLDAEAIARSRFEEVRRELSGRAERKFVQLAVFDHVFTGKPDRPPIVTLAWKDWRGDPVVKHPPKPAPLRHSGSPPPIVRPEDRKNSEAAIAVLKKSVPPGRRKASDDLIGELFEAMHELHFVADVVGGCDYLLAVLKTTMPAEGVLIHVFDINRRYFVIVRAQGPGYADVILHQTLDTDRFVVEYMRGTRARKWDEKPPDHFTRDAWQKLGVNVRTAMFGPIVQGGRYLGIIEIANPVGGGPFFDAELNALEYICEQLAVFLANRPIVLDREAVLPR